MIDWTAILFFTVPLSSHVTPPLAPPLLPSPLPPPLHTRAASFPFFLFLQLEGFGLSKSDLDSAASSAEMGFSEDLVRTSPYMTHPVFNTHHSEVGGRRLVDFLAVYPGEGFFPFFLFLFFVSFVGLFLSFSFFCAHVFYFCAHVFSFFSFFFYLGAVPLVLPNYQLVFFLFLSLS